MRTIRARPLTREGFSAFGEVLESPPDPGRLYFEEALCNGRPEARASLSMIRRAPVEALPLTAKVMERHEFSSQTFLPLGEARWMVIVAPHAAGAAAPDTDRAEAFLVGSGQGVTYGANIWHHPLTVLDAPARFAVLMWRTGTSTDEEFQDVAPFLVTPG
jgi:ureidoglycolate lyase